MTAIERLRSQYVTEGELAALLNVTPERIRDLRSYHVNGKHAFIDHIKPSSKCVLYKVTDVESYLDNLNVCSFGTAKDNLDEE